MTLGSGIAVAALCVCLVALAVLAPYGALIIGALAFMAFLAYLARISSLWHSTHDDLGANRMIHNVVASAIVLALQCELVAARWS